MWATLGKWLVKGAVWCLEHPDAVQAAVSDALAVKKAVADAKGGQ